MKDRVRATFAHAPVEENDQLYRLIAETIPHMVWTGRPDGRLDFFNSRVFDYTGMTAHELSGSGWRPVIHPDQWQKSLERWTHALASGEPYRIECGLRRHDGEYRWHLATAVPLRDARGRIVKWFGTCTDIEDPMRRAERREAKIAERTSELAESEARFRSLVNLSTDFYWETDTEHRFTVLDVGGKPDVGFFAASRLGRTRWEVPYVLPDADGWRTYREALDARRSFRDFETARPTANGGVRHYSISGEPVFDAQGVFRGYRGVGREITERKRAERALRDSEERYRNLVELSEDAIIVRQDGCIGYANPAAVRLFGAARTEDLLGQRMLDMAHPDDRARVRERERKLDVERKSLPLVQLRLRRADGSYAEVEALAAPIMFEGREAVLVVLRDLGPRRQTEHALRDSEARFQAFMSNAPAVAWIKDSLLRYTYVSPSYERQHERKSEELLGRDDFEAWPKAVAQAFRNNDKEVLSAQRAFQTIETSVYEDGSAREWLVVKFPLPDRTGECGVAGMGIDITERVRSESKLKEYSAHVRQLLNRLSELQESERRRLAVHLHDVIGQNLSALGIGLDIVRAELPAGNSALTGRLNGMSDLLEQIVSSTRDVMAELRPTVLDDYGLVPALRWYAEQFEAHTGLHSSVTGALLPRRLSPEAELAVFRMVQEALTNAAKHSGATTVKIVVLQTERSVRIAVEDDGRGLVEPLGARASMRGGWGLPLMRERAEAIGGVLHLESPEIGTRVVIDVPLPDADPGRTG